MPTSDKIRLEIQKRIRISVAAYAYELQDDSLIDDFHFDRLCLEIDPNIDTGNAAIDKFFKEEFDPCTGQWIHSHPHMDRLEQIYIYMKEIGC